MKLLSAEEFRVLRLDVGGYRDYTSNTWEVGEYQYTRVTINGEYYYVELGEAEHKWPKLPVVANVIEGGEDLYIHPFSYDDRNRTNKVLYFDSPEFAPYECDFIISTVDDYMPMLYMPYTKLWKLRNFYYMYIKRSFVAISRYIDFLRNHGWGIRDSWVFRYEYYQSVPYIGVEAYNYHISTRGQLVINDPDNLIKYTYLNPSWTWLEGKVNEWLKDEPVIQTDSESELETLNWMAEQKKEYTTWRDNQIAKGLSIGYLCSLDT